MNGNLNRKVSYYLRRFLKCQFHRISKRKVAGRVIYVLREDTIRKLVIFILIICRCYTGLYVFRCFTFFDRSPADVNLLYFLLVFIGFYLRIGVIRHSRGQRKEDGVIESRKLMTDEEIISRDQQSFKKCNLTRKSL